MYEQHFELKKQPFSAVTTGADVFVGPQTAKTMEGFRKALTARDAVVTVSGRPGTGKTTLVHRAIDAIGTKFKTVRVGRMKMDSNDVLEALLVVLGVELGHVGDAPGNGLQWLLDALFDRALAPMHPSCDDPFSASRLATPISPPAEVHR